MNETIEELARRLNGFERMFLTGWIGTLDNYTITAEGLHERRLITRDWTLTAKGKAVRAHLEAQL